MKTAFLFPGQGAQLVGMGRDIAEKWTVAADIFKKADDLAGFELSRVCFEGPQEKIDSTVMSQPAIFVTSAAILEVVRSSQFAQAADITAGLSLGEYTALYAAGVLDFEDALKLVIMRGRVMQQAAEQTNGSMVSIIGLDSERVFELCREAAEGGLLEPVNFNCPGQIVVSGDKDACERAVMLAEKYGAVKAIPLAVAGAFHTRMMGSAAEQLEQALNGCNIIQPSGTKIIANVSAKYYKDGDEIASGLIKQLTSPILWQKCMEKLLSDGVEKFYEIGPGRVLTGLMRRINRKIKVVNLSNSVSLAEFV